MSQSTLPSPDGLQFETAEPANGPVTAGRPVCAGCNRPITAAYYTVGSKAICPACRERVDGRPPGNPAARVAKAAAFGLGAALAGAVVWYAIRHFLHLQIGLVAVLVGYMVGKAVLAGSGNRGGRPYQVLAVLLTYCGIAANYVPDLVEAFWSDGGHGPLVSAVDIVIAAFKRPVLLGTKSPLGLLIAAFALWEAWKLTAGRRMRLAGPFQVAAAAPAVPPPLPGAIL